MILMNDFKNEPQDLLDAEIDACKRVLNSGYWILGKEVINFEKVWSSYIDISYTVGCANGLDAIEIGLRALNIGLGDEVITTPNTAFATVLAIIRSGATPVLADINPDNGMLDPNSVKRCINKNTKAIILVHLYGQIGPINELLEVSKNSNLHLIEDCAQAHGAKFENKFAGSFGIFAAWSFYPTKNLGAVGDAGALTTNNLELAEKARSIANYGQSVRYHHPYIGMNSRLDELQAALLSERIKYLDAWTIKRRNIANIYSNNIKNKFINLMPLPIHKEGHVHHLFVVNSDKRDNLQTYLKEKSISTLIHYPIPIHHQPPCLSIKKDPQGLTNSEIFSKTCISLPCHPGLSTLEIEKIIMTINSFENK